MQLKYAAINLFYCVAMFRLQYFGDINEISFQRNIKIVNRDLLFCFLFVCNLPIIWIYGIDCYYVSEFWKQKNENCYYCWGKRESQKHDRVCKQFYQKQIKKEAKFKLIRKYFIIGN